LTGPLFTSLRQAKHKIFQHQLNEFMSLDRHHWIEVRQTIQQLFSKGSPLESDKEKVDQLLHKIDAVEMHLPAKIGDYTDFYASRNHAFNVGSIIRGPENALAENWLHIPIGYHGRSSSVVVKGDVIRPHGQSKPPGAEKPQFGECKRLDFELEIGVFVGGKTNHIGHPLKVNKAWDNIFGLVLLNDWSFRDFQTWEYVPLGPFTSKNGITTISPWIVTLEALEGAKVELPPQVPTPLEYLQEKEHKSFDIDLTVELSNGNITEVISKSNMKYLYWSIAQQLAHHSVSGCPMKPGDLFGTGTISGPEKDSLGCLLEMTWGGKNPIKFGE
jgi:fumarylacetoacetase